MSAGPEVARPAVIFVAVRMERLEGTGQVVTILRVHIHYLSHNRCPEQNLMHDEENPGASLPAQLGVRLTT
jgi:hypothetical protein